MGKFLILFSLFVSTIFLGSCVSIKKKQTMFSPDNSFIQYTGRIDFTDTKVPRFWNPGVYFQFYYEGDSCEVILNDEVPWKDSHNYISVVVDDGKSERIHLQKKENRIVIGKNLKQGRHKVLVCKGTESGIGYLELVGINCQELVEPESKPVRKMEFYGNSITCGTGSDQSLFPCDSGAWHDKHNAYLSYGPVTARKLNAQWVLTSVSGIGMVHSCCDMDILMPDVYDKVNLRSNQISWDFSLYQPDVVTIALGQNDGIQDSTLFCGEYVKFIHALRSKYPDATIVCMNSPMADENLNPVLKRYLTGIVQNLNDKGDNLVYKFFLSRRFHSGCDEHPDLKEHAMIADELSAFIKGIMKW